METQAISKLKQAIKRLPVVSTVCRFAYYRLIEPLRAFSGSEDYWKARYSRGGTSGDGSYDALAAFKAEVINSLVRQHAISSVIEFGCGDGNQLVLAEYPSYLGVDISPEAIERCKQLFRGDATKSFVLLSDYADQQAELGMSLDVIYHLVEDEVFQSYLGTLFAAATRLIIIYSSNTAVQKRAQGKHVRHREFTRWVSENYTEWDLLQHIPNRYPYSDKDESGSFADFYIYRHLGHSS